MSKKVPVRLLSLAALLAITLPGSAQVPVGKKPQAGTQLPPVVITPTRTERTLLEVPATLHMLDHERLLGERQVRTLPDALGELPGVLLQKTTHGHGSPYIRGFTGYLTLMVIDGVRLNNSVFRAGPNQYWNTVDPASFDRMELFKGPGSVLYGSDAVGGTLQGLTRRLKKFGQGLGWERRFSYRYSAGDNSHVARAEVLGSVDDRLRFWLAGAWKDFGNLNAGGDVDRMRNTGYDEWTGDLKLEYDLTDDAKLVFFHQQVVQDDVWRVHKTIFGKSWRGTTVGSEYERSLDQVRRLTYLQYHDKRVGNSFLRNFKASLSWQEQDEERNRIRPRSGQVRNDIQAFDVDTFGLWMQAETPLAGGLLTYGAEVYRDEVTSRKKEYRDGVFNSFSIQGPVGDEADYTVLAFFLQDEIELGRDFTATLGARYTWVEAGADRVEDPNTGNPIAIDDTYDALVGSARLLWRAADPVSVFVGASQGFRAPNLSDLTRLDTARSNEIETPSPDLDPEYYLSYELGARVETGTVRAQGALFYTDIRDMIVRTPTGTVIGGDNEVTKRNAGDGYITGLELAGSWRFLPQWSCFGNFTWFYGEVSTYPTSAPVKRDEPIDRLMPATVRLGVRWEDRDRKIFAEALGTIAGEAGRLSTRDKSDTQRIPPGGTPAYEILTLRGGWEFRDGWRLNLAVENVFDRAYRVHGSGQNEVGINMVMGLNLLF